MRRYSRSEPIGLPTAIVFGVVCALLGAMSQRPNLPETFVNWLSEPTETTNEGEEIGSKK